MQINFDRLIKIYGEEYILIIKENIDEIAKNLAYFEALGFSDIEDIFERVVPIFIYDNQTFKSKMDQFIKKLGSNYIQKIENDISLLEGLE